MVGAPKERASKWIRDAETGAQLDWTSQQVQLDSMIGPAKRRAAPGLLTPDRGRPRTRSAGAAMATTAPRWSGGSSRLTNLLRSDSTGATSVDPTEARCAGSKGVVRARPSAYRAGPDAGWPSRAEVGTERAAGRCRSTEPAPRCSPWPTRRSRAPSRSRVFRRSMTSDLDAEETGPEAGGGPESPTGDGAA
jgi:hypothetical protein